MTKKRTTRKAEPPCAELRPDDGVDPRTLFRGQEGNRNNRRKDWQLCKQAFHALSMTIDQLASQDWAAGLYLLDVSPAPFRVGRLDRSRW